MLLFVTNRLESLNKSSEYPNKPNTIKAVKSHSRLIVRVLVFLTRIYYQYYNL